MADSQLIDLADRYSRRRAALAALAATVFVGSQVLGRPRVFGDGAPATRIDWWAVNAVVLLIVLATGGGLLNRRRVRALVQDEVARSHLRTAVQAGYWVATGLGMVLYVAPWFHGFTGQQVIYVLVTASVAVSLFTFAGLERRAHADG